MTCRLEYQRSEAYGPRGGTYLVHNQAIMGDVSYGFMRAQSIGSSRRHTLRARQPLHYRRTHARVSPPPNSPTHPEGTPVDGLTCLAPQFDMKPIGCRYDNTQNGQPSCTTMPLMAYACQARRVHPYIVVTQQLGRGPLCVIMASAQVRSGK